MAEVSESDGKANLWRRGLRACEQSGLSQRAFCEREGLSVSTLQSWKRRLRSNAEASRAKKRKRPPDGGSFRGRFVPVGITGRGALLGDGPIEIVLARGRTVRVRAGFDLDALRRGRRTG